MKARHAGLPLLIVLASALLPAAVNAGPWMLKPNEYYTEMRGNRFSSDRMWDVDGNSVNFAPISTVEERGITSYTEIGWKDWMSVSMQIPFKSRTIRQGYPHQHLTETGLSDFSLGLRFKLMEGTNAGAIDVVWHTPLGYQRDAVPPLGTGTQDFIGALSLGTAMPSLDTFVQGAAGYRYRLDDKNPNDDPPAEIMLRADVGTWLNHAFQVAAHYRSFMATGTSSDAEKRSQQGAGVQASFHTDAGFNIFTGWTHVFAGENSLDLDDIYVGFAFRHTSLNRLQGFLGSKQAR